MILQFHVLSPRGDCIITRDFRKDCPSGTADKYFRRVKFWEGGAPPIFAIDGIHYISVNKSGIHFVFTTRASVSPTWAVNLLNKLVKSFKDFCGVLSEESLRRNFILVYELIDEIIDCGYPQTTASEVLKLSIHSDAVDTTLPVMSISNPLSMLPQFRSVNSPSSTIPSSANQRPIGLTSSGFSTPPSLTVGGVTLPASIKIPGLNLDSGSASKNEIFVDILERVTVVVNAAGGETVTASIDGSIQMKSYLSGNPALKLSLNDDLVIASDGRGDVAYSSSAVLEDALFHECADLTEFESSRIISLIPPDGEFVLMNYRIASFSKLPFRLYPSIELVASDRVDIHIAIRADLPDQNYGSNMVVSIPVPKGAVRSVYSDVPGGTSEWIAGEDRIVWTIKKLAGGQEASCRARINLIAPPVDGVKSFGPVSLQFEVPMYSVSNLQVKYLRINDARHGSVQLGGSPTGSGPFRWVRYVAQSQSYVFR